MLERRPAGSEESRAGGGQVGAGPGAWGGLWARALDLPFVELAPGPTVGDRAVVIAGFRDQYYGLVDTVREASADEDGGGAPLITSGAVDWAANAWGDRPTRYAKRRWHRARRRPPAARRGARGRAALGGAHARPKLVVATQTRVVEAAVDVGGTWVPSVPTLAVMPADPGDLWHLAAAVLSPAATAWFARRSAGTGLDRGALKVAGPDLSALPLPGDAAAWDDAAAALQASSPRPTGVPRRLPRRRGHGLRRGPGGDRVVA